MNPERIQAYLYFIQELTRCSPGSEEATLQERPDLLDTDLLEMMKQMAAAEKNPDAASRLNALTELLEEKLNPPPADNREETANKDRLNLIFKVLKATRDSQGNPQVVYPILQRNLAQLDDKFAKQLRTWATARLSEVSLQQAERIAATIGDFGNLIQQFPLGNKAANMEIAIAGYEISLTVFTRHSHREAWATIQNNLGLAYSNRIRDDRAENLEKAVEAFQLALEVYTKNDFPIQWAMTQNNLGNAYKDRIRHDRAENLEKAINAYQLALEVRTKKDFPIDWAQTQNNLGAAYLYRIRHDRAENLEKAIEAYQLALEVCTKKDFPIQWAATQNNLGAAYSNRIRHDRAENLEKAIEAYQLALEVRTKKDLPIDWAGTQNNLGAAYLYRIRHDRAENLEKAIEAYQLALEVRTKNDFPIDWAGTQNNLGGAYSNRIRHDRAENLEKAIEAYQLALEVYTKKDFPIDWAATQNNLGAAYSNRIRHDRAENLEKAIEACQLALDVYTKKDLPIDWAGTQNNLGAAYSNRIRHDRAENLEKAIEAYQLALEVFTKKDFPIDWARTQNNLGNAYSDRIRHDRAENLEKAIEAYQLALDVYTKKDFPIEWATTQNNLGIAYSDRIRDDRAENLEKAIEAYQLALDVRTKNDFPIDWAGTQNNLGGAYSNRIRHDRAENLEKAIEAYQLALEVYTKKDFPIDWAATQNNLGGAYSNRIRHDRAENLEKAIEAYQLALEVRTLKADPITCLNTSRSLGKLHFQQGNWQAAIDAYKQAITAVELSRSWSKDDDRRQEILADAIGVYENTVQCFVNLQQYPQAFEYAERSRSRQLVDLMASKDLYHQGEIPPEVKELLKKFDTLEREIHNLRFPNQSPDNGEMKGAAATTRKRAAWEATNEKIAKKEAEKQQVYRQMRQLDRVLAEQIQVAPLDFARLQQLIDNDTTAILSFYSTDDDTHAFIVRRSGVDVHTCQGQGYRELQIWLYENWLKPYADISYLPGFTAAAQLLGCEVEAIKSVELGETEITVLLEDGTSQSADKSQFEKLWKQADLRLKSDWHQQMPSKLAEIARRLQLDKLVEKLEGIQELILIPHLYLHQIPFAALPVGEQQYLGDKFLIRTLASCQVLDFCAQRPALATERPTYGIVEDTIQDLPCATYEGRQVAQMYQVADSQYLKGSQAKVSEYKKLLPQVQRLLSTHHAQSRLDNNLESALILADGKITLGQLLSPAFRFPNLDEIFLSCCETNLGTTDVSDNMMSLNTGFLCAGARGAVSTLWSVAELATSLFSIFYHHLRQAGKNRPEALQLAQQQLRQLTGKEFEEKYQQELDKVLAEKLGEAGKSLKEAKKQRNAYPKDSPEYKEWEEERVKRALLYKRIGEIRNKGLKEAAEKAHPFAEIQYWSGFICAGLR